MDEAQTFVTLICSEYPKHPEWTTTATEAGMPRAGIHQEEAEFPVSFAQDSCSFVEESGFVCGRMGRLKP